MAAAWVPQEAGVAQICSLLTEYQKPGTNQNEILAQLEQCRAFPDFNNYLAFIFAQGDSLPVEVRQSAGLLLKNNIKQQYATTTEAFRTFIKAALLYAIGNPVKALRHTVGTNVAVIVALGGLAAWPELLAALVQCLDSQDPNALEGGLDTLYKICEDTPRQLEAGVNGLAESPAAVLVPRLLALFNSPHADCKCLAVAILNLLAGSADHHSAARMPAAVASHVDTYLQGLFVLARDESSAVRRAVCTGLVQLLHLVPEKLAPNMPDIIEYMLASTQDGDEGVALESCEFWSAFCEAHDLEPGELRPFLPRLVPVLLKNMVYDEYDEEVQDAEAAEEQPAGQQDRDQEIKPFIHKGANHTRGEEEGESDGEEVNRWNLRKCSAAGLDVLSTVFGEELLPIVTPIVQQRIQDKDWRARESAILALGAISEGCHRGLVPYLGELVSMLAPKLLDERPLVRSITCWALSRYAEWLVQDGSQPNTVGQQQLDLVINGLLSRVLDHNKHVQEAACSALATLEEAAGPELLPRLRTILETLARACGSYGRKNLRILYDALSTLADAVGRALAEPSFLSIFMPPLIAKWGALPDTDRELLPLLECFTSIAQAIGPSFEQFAEPCFERCIRIVTSQLGAKQAVAAGQPTEVEPEREFIMCALDLISGMAEALGPSIESLVGRSPLRELLLQCCQDPSPDVRQSAFALVGDLAKVAAPHLQPCLKELVALSVANLEAHMIRHENMSACNNACWSLGELAIKSLPEDLHPYAVSIVERLVPILAASGQMPRSIVENSAITLGRVAWMCPDAIAPHLEAFVGPWCQALRLIRDDIEKEHAFLGLTCMIRINPKGAVTSMVSLVEAVLSWRVIRCEGLRNDVTGMLQMYKQRLQEAAQWEQLLALLSPAARTKLLQEYQL